MSVLTTLFYWRVLPPIVRGMAWLLERTLASAAPSASFRHLGSAAVHPSLSFTANPQRIVPGHDRRQAGIAARLVLYATLSRLDPGCRRAFRDRLCSGHRPILISLIMVPETSDKRRRPLKIRHMRPRPWMRSSRAPRRD
jgi:CNT family concentrative nucleoside transporter